MVFNDDETQSVKVVNSIRTKGTHNAKVVDVQMPFKSMVIFLVKLALASIPAMIILGIFFSLFGSMLFSFLN